MFDLPQAPVFPEDHATTWQGQLRYEDVAQDGRLMPLALPSQLGGLWRGLLSKHPGNRAATREGIVPILTRMVLTTTPQHIRLDRPVEGRGGYQIARAADRLHLLMWLDVLGATGRLVPPEPAGELAVAGRMFAEHTFTRPFGPPDQRKVTELPADGFGEVTATYAPPPPPALDGMTPDSTDLAFALDQTDSNQHVNSLVYIRWFLEAVQRRFAAEGRSLKRRSRCVEIAYRKPCFAGDRIRIHLRADDDGASGYVAGADDGKPRCYVRAEYSA